MSNAGPGNALPVRKLGYHKEFNLNNVKVW